MRRGRRPRRVLRDAHVNMLSAQRSYPISSTLRGFIYRAIYRLAAADSLLYPTLIPPISVYSFPLRFGSPMWELLNENSLCFPISRFRLLNRPKEYTDGIVCSTDYVGRPDIRIVQALCPIGRQRLLLTAAARPLSRGMCAVQVYS